MSGSGPKAPHSATGIGTPRLTYITITPMFKICPHHGYLDGVVFGGGDLKLRLMFDTITHTRDAVRSIIGRVEAMGGP